MGIREELLAIKGNAEFLICEKAHEWAENNRNSDLAKSLEWDDEKAGYQYRLWQIRRLVSIHVLYAGGGPRKLISLTIDRSKAGGGYRDLEQVRNDQSLLDIALRDALHELERLRDRYEYLTSLQPVWTAAQRVRRSAQAKGRRKKGGGASRKTA